MFKRTPWRRRRRRRRRRRWIRIRLRRIVRRVCKYGRYHPHYGKYAVFTSLGLVVQKQVSLTLG